ncbi:acyl-CoA dehydrogenase, partial [Mycobacterium sp. ITM-2017-0098]
APFPEILEPVRRMAHGCASSAWTIGFYTLHNWMLALFSEQAQGEAFATRPFLAPAPLAPTGHGVACNGGIRLTGKWSWATGVMDG